MRPRPNIWRALVRRSVLLLLAGFSLLCPRYVKAAEPRDKPGVPFQMYRSAEELWKAGKHEAAAEEYLRIVEKNPGHEKAYIGVNYAAVFFIRAKRYNKGLETYERLVREYPNSDLTQHATKQVARVADELFDFNKAIRFYDLLVRRYPEHEDRPEAARLVAVYRDALGDRRGAIRAYRRYLKLYPRAQDAAAIHLRIAQIQRDSGNRRGMLRTLKQFLHRGAGPQDHSQVLEAHLIIGDHHRDRGKSLRNRRKKRAALRRSRESYEQAMRYFEAQGLPMGRAEARLAGRAAFERAELDLQELRRPFGGRALRSKKTFEKAIKRQLKQKMRLVDDLREQYEKVMRYGDAELYMAATYRIAENAWTFAELIVTAPLPPGERPQGRGIYDEYRPPISDAMLPFHEKAVQGFRIVIESAERNKHHSQWVTRARQALAELRPEEYKANRPPRSILLGPGGRTELPSQSQVPIPDPQTARQAREVAREARTELSGDPHDVARHVALARALLDLGDYQGAEREAIWALQRYGRNLQFIILIGDIHAARGRPLLADLVYTRALEMYPDNADLWFRRACHLVDAAVSAGPNRE